MTDIAKLTADIVFYKERAEWWCAYAENGLHSLPDAVDLRRASGIIADEKREHDDAL